MKKVIPKFSTKPQISTIEKLSRLLTLSLMVSLTVQSQEALSAPPTVATAENLAQFELQAPVLTPQEKFDAAIGEALEKDMQYQQELFEDTLQVWEMFPTSTQTDDIKIEIYHHSKKVGKQFLLARQNGQIRFVFAISTGRPGNSTPGGRFGVIGQRWRHMSTKYPGPGENNMDHVTYFKPAYGFHATTFGAYAKLGKKDSHGCVRMGRPEARAIYRLIKNNLPTVSILSYNGKEEPDDSEVDLIRKQLALDFNLIQHMLKTHNRGDIPLNESKYFQFAQAFEDAANGNGEPPLIDDLRKKYIEISPEQDLGRVPFRTLAVEM